MTTCDLLIACEAVGIHLEVRGDHLHVEAPASVVTPTLRDALQQHKADLLTLLAPVTEFVTLRGGLVLPVPALQVALDLERRGCTLRMDEQQDVIVDPNPALTEMDWAAIHRWRRHLAAILRYECPGGELPQCGDCLSAIQRDVNDEAATDQSKAMLGGVTHGEEDTP